jgi:hypothetical protein
LTPLLTMPHQHFVITINLLVYRPAFRQADFKEQKLGFFPCGDRDNGIRGHPATPPQRLDTKVLKSKPNSGLKYPLRRLA